MKSLSRNAAEVAASAGYEKCDALARELGVSTAAVAAWSRSGRVPGMRIGNSWWVDAKIAREVATTSKAVARAKKLRAPVTQIGATVVSMDVVEAMLRAIVAEAVAEIRSLLED